MAINLLLYKGVIRAQYDCFDCTLYRSGLPIMNLSNELVVFARVWADLDQVGVPSVLRDAEVVIALLLQR